ncbi:MAG: hypothetical protein AUK48_13020 [Oscillatoriales cyanobacterium CG2_30_44_21]|nr:MAG: hypothetical protein AUK48_13020 [Oscillatoriales cyanobacterium CG2_30_44_21]
MQANPAIKSTTPQSGYQASVPVTVYRELAAELQSTQAKLSFFQLQNDQLTRQNQMLLQEFEAIAQSTGRVQAILSQSNLPESKLSGVLAGIRASAQVAAAPAKTNPQPQGRPPAKPRTADKPATTQPNPRKTAVQQTNHAIQEAISRARQLATEAAPPSSQSATQEAIAGETLYYESAFAGFDTPVTSQVTKPLPKLEIREEISSRPLRTDSSNREDASEVGLSGWMLVLTIAAIVLTSFGAGYLLMRPFVK